MIYFLLNILGALALRCLNHNGAPIGWWTILQLPKSSVDKCGIPYFYFDKGSEYFSPVETPADENSPLSYTIAQLNADEDVSVLLYK